MLGSMPTHPDVVIPDRGSTTGRAILSRALDRLRSDFGALDLGEGRMVREVVARLLKSAPGAVFSALRLPTVGALVRVMRSGDATLGAELAATLAFELAALRALDRPIALPVPKRVLSLAGRARLEPRAKVAFSAGAIEIDGEAREIVASPDLYTPIGETGIVLALDDNNPLSMFEAHPDKAGNAIDLGGRRAAEWVHALEEALSIVERYLPELHAEFCLFVRQIVPVGFDRDAHLSASYREAIGTLYLTLHPNAMTMAEALIHEFSHNKLNALFETDDVLRNPPDATYASPVRPDARPIAGVLLAVHAFLPVARLYELMIAAGDPRTADPGFERRFRDIARGNAEGASVLREHAIPTDQGRALLGEIDRWIRHFDG
jgi:HEXXH motif-containing protein